MTTTYDRVEAMQARLGKLLTLGRLECSWDEVKASEDAICWLSWHKSLPMHTAIRAYDLYGEQAIYI